MERILSTEKRDRITSDVKHRKKENLSNIHCPWPGIWQAIICE
jgi:hypothetical protein